MAQLDDWTQIPTSLLDAGQRLQDAESWAKQQRTTLAETWANAQRQAIAASANAWQQGTAALDSFKQGFSGQATPGYNDMAGASSSYRPPMGGVAGMDQATSPAGPTNGTPLSQVPMNVLNAGINQVNQTEQNLENTPAYSPQAIDNASNMVMGVTGGEDMPLAGEGRNLIGKALGLGAPDATASNLVNDAAQRTVRATEVPRPGAIGTENIDLPMTVEQHRQLLESGIAKLQDLTNQYRDQLATPGIDDYTRTRLEHHLRIAERDLASRQSQYAQLPKPAGPPSAVAKIGQSALLGGAQGAVGGGIGASQNQNATPGSVALGALQGGLTGAARGAVGAGVREGLPADISGQFNTALSRVANATAPASKEGFAGNIRLEKLPEGVRDIVTEAYNAAPATFEKARRGVIPDAEVAQLADQVGSSVDKIVKQWQPGQAKNAETLLALRNALASKAQAVVDAQQAVKTSNSVENLLKLQLALKEHAAIQETVAGTTAEAGRALRQFRQSVSGAIASGDQSKMEDVLKKLGGRDWTEELAQKFGQLDTTDPTQVATFIRDIYKPKAADYLNEWFYNAILSSPSTHIANTVSNTLNALTTIPERALAGAIDVPLSALQGRPQGRFVGEAKSGAYGLLQGLPEGVRAATYAMQHGFSPEEALKGEKIRGQAFKGPIGNAINVPSRLLNAADAFYRPILQRATLNSLVYRQAASEGLSGKALANRISELTANVPAPLLEQSAKEAEYRLYRQAPKTIANALTMARGMKVAGVEPLRFVIPFVQVPVNATKYGLERSPLGFLNPDLWKNLANKDPAAADNIARAGMGSLIAAAIGSQVQNGNLDITGAAPTAPAQRDAFYREGKLPFAVKIGGTWYSYQRWEPFNHALTQVASAVDAIRNAKAGMGAPDIAMQAALTIGQNIESQTFLTGLNNLLNAATDPGRYGAQFAAQLETGPLPASGALRTAANLMDTRQRQPQGAIENVENVLPGLSQNVPSRLNNYGEEQQQAGSPLLPYKAQQANLSPIDAELSKYGVEPGATGKTMHGIDLTRQEQADYQRISGQHVKAMLGQVINDPRYGQLNDVQKARLLQLTITRAKDQAAQQYLGQLVQTQGKAALIQRIQQKKLAALPRAG